MKILDHAPRAADPRLSEQQIADVASGLSAIHDHIIGAIGDAYVTVSASWQGPGDRVVTLSLSTVETDEDDEDDELPEDDIPDDHDDVPTDDRYAP